MTFCRSDLLEFVLLSLISGEDKVSCVGGNIEGYFEKGKYFFLCEDLILIALELVFIDGGVLMVKMSEIAKKVKAPPRIYLRDSAISIMIY